MDNNDLVALEYHICVDLGRGGGGKGDPEYPAKSPRSTEEIIYGYSCSHETQHTRLRMTFSMLRRTLSYIAAGVTRERSRDFEKRLNLMPYSGK